MGFFEEKTKRYLLAATMQELLSLFMNSEQIMRQFSFGKVLLIKKEEGIIALAGTCPHQGKSMKGCRVESNHIVCPWHQYRFSRESGRGHGLYLAMYPIVETAEGVYLERTYFGFW
jgi:nitrite reductase/ring-hydroxylating ferredoxin subunit